MPPLKVCINRILNALVVAIRMMQLIAYLIKPLHIERRPLTFSHQIILVPFHHAPQPLGPRPDSLLALDRLQSAVVSFSLWPTHLP